VSEKPATYELAAREQLEAKRIRLQKLERQLPRARQDLDPDRQQSRLENLADRVRQIVGSAGGSGRGEDALIVLGRLRELFDAFDAPAMVVAAAAELRARIAEDERRLAPPEPPAV
jgi:hypothetical protein